MGKSPVVKTTASTSMDKSPLVKTTASMSTVHGPTMHNPVDPDPWISHALPSLRIGKLTRNIASILPTD